MARISTRNLIDGGERVAPPTTVKPTITAATTPAVTSTAVTNKPLTPAQIDARKNAEALAKQVGAKIDPVTGLIDKSTVTNPFGIYGPQGGKTVLQEGYRGSGSSRVYFKRFADGTEEVSPAPLGGTTGGGNTGGAPQGRDDAAADALVAFNKAQAEAATKATRESAFALLKKEFDKYGLSSLADTVKSYIMQGSPVEEVTLRLRATPEYQARFAGNEMRLKAGLNVYDEATYLQLENAYDQVFTSYGVMEAAGNTAEARRARYAQFIGGTISPDEIKGRVQLAVAAANEDEVTKATLKQLYPSISDKDIVSYFLNPKETLPKLETKIRASQIGAAAVRQGLVTNVATAEELAAMGITEQEAERAYSAYAGIKPTLDLLSGLEKDQELAVNQQVAEGALLKGLASEQRKIEGLKQKELARFGGSSGTARGVSLNNQMGGAY